MISQLIVAAEAVMFMALGSVGVDGGEGPVGRITTSVGVMKPCAHNRMKGFHAYICMCSFPATREK